MSEVNPFQVRIVGKDCIPVRRPKTSKWEFIYNLAEELKDGQAIQLVIPMGQSLSAAKQTWYRLNRGNGHCRAITQADGSSILYLWFGKNTRR